MPPANLNRNLSVALYLTANRGSGDTSD